MTHKKNPIVKSGFAHRDVNKYGKISLFWV